MLCLSHYCLCFLFNKIGERSRTGSTYKRRGCEWEGGGGGRGEKCPQTMYAHMSKWTKMAGWVSQVIRAPATSTFSLGIVQMMSHEIFATGCLSLWFSNSDCHCNNRKYTKMCVCLRPCGEDMPLTNNVKSISEPWPQQNLMDLSSSKMNFSYVPKLS
jgi:hypothetical protein